MFPKFLYETKYLALDTETTGLLPHQGDRPFAFSFTSYEGESHYERFKVENTNRKVEYDSRIEEIGELLARRLDNRLWTVFHNASFDLSHILSALTERESSLRLREQLLQSTGRIWDTIILSHCTNSARQTFALKPLCKQLLGIGDSD